MVIKVEVFTSPTCPHCPGAVKAVEAAKEEVSDLEIDICNVNDEQNRQKAINYGIMAVPSIVINGAVEFVGAPTLNELLDKLKQ